MALDAVLFDLDGTLVDTNPAHVRAWQQALETHGYRVAPDRIEVEIGKGGDTLVPSVLGKQAEDKDGEALREAYGKAFLAIAEKERFEVFPQVRELLAALRKRGLKLVLATSSKKEYQEAIARSSGLDLESEFDLLITASDAKASKPAPDLINAAVEKLQMSPAQCVMVGDTQFDAQAAKMAGVLTIGLLCGGNPRETLQEAGARAIYEDAADLLAHLDEALERVSLGSAHLTQKVMETLMCEALSAAREGATQGEVPIGSVLARGDGTIIVRGWNEKVRTQSKIAHAEMQVLAKSAGQVPLDARDLILVSTLEPCVMATGAAMEAAVDTIVFALPAPSDGGTTRVVPPRSQGSQMPRIVGNVLAEESRALLQNWLRDNAKHPSAAYVQGLMRS